MEDTIVKRHPPPVPLQTIDLEPGGSGGNLDDVSGFPHGEDVHNNISRGSRRVELRLKGLLGLLTYTAGDAITKTLNIETQD